MPIIISLRTFCNNIDFEQQARVKCTKTSYKIAISRVILVLCLKCNNYYRVRKILACNEILQINSAGRKTIYSYDEQTLIGKT